jgi:phosphonate transport system substrate-binding protein
VPEAAFGRLDTVAAPEDAVVALLDRRVDAALAWEPVAGPTPSAATTAPAAVAPGRGPLAVTRRPGADALRIVWASPPVPHGPHVVRADLPVAWRVRLRDLLVHLETDDPAAYDAAEPEFGGGFVPVDKAAFAPLADILAAP